MLKITDWNWQGDVSEHNSKWHRRNYHAQSLRWIRYYSAAVSFLRMTKSEHTTLRLSETTGREGPLQNLLTTHLGTAMSRFVTLKIITSKNQKPPLKLHPYWHESYHSGTWHKSNSWTLQVSIPSPKVMGTEVSPEGYTSITVKHQIKIFR